MSRIVLLRHGQSSSNAEGVFTGWTDVPLTAAGEREASTAAALLRSEGITPDVVHTSVLSRSIRTAEIVLDGLGRPWLPVRRSWRLNERQYGAMTGRNKSQVRAELGPGEFQSVRRSFDQRPPAMSADEVAGLRRDPRYAGLPAGTVPDAESLAEVLARVVPYWVDVVAADLRDGRTPLIVAHGNSLRALVMHLDRLSPTEVAELNIPTGIPLCYELDDDLTPRIPGHYLDAQAAAKAAAAVAAEGG